MDTLTGRKVDAVVDAADVVSPVEDALVDEAEATSFYPTTDPLLIQFEVTHRGYITKIVCQHPTTM